MKRRLSDLKSIAIQRTNIRLSPDQNRVILRALRFATDGEYLRVIHRVLALSEADVQRALNDVIADYSSRHRKLSERFLSRFRYLEHYVPLTEHLTEDRKLLMGSYFLFEYSVESAALFNPSIVPHPDQTGLPKGSLRFLMSLRSTGEGHISSVSFRSGVIDARHRISLDPSSRFLTEPELIENPTYNKDLFLRKIHEIGLADNWSERIMGRLADNFTLAELSASLREALDATGPNRHFDDQATVSGIWLLARNNYEIHFPQDQDLSECVIMPVTPLQSNGIEDVRLVAHRNDDGGTTYIATYTAYDGRNVLPQLFATEDFRHFKFTTLNGLGARNKGMALFPRNIDGRYAMLSRQDGDSVYLTTSDNLHFWPEPRKIVAPQYAWEVLKMGNCGSPIETKEGWLVISHGVGPMRQYCLGAFLLDLKDPTKVIARLREPLMKPEGAEREGYVPNVLYTCGTLVYEEKLLLPYGISDRVTGFAWISIDEILAAMS